MTIRARTPEETYGPALAIARQQFARTDPERIATLARVAYAREGTTSGVFAVRFLSIEFEVLWPDGSASHVVRREPADITTHILLLHYLLTADGTPMASTWVAFRSLPGGMGYEPAFQARANLRLAQRFGHDRPAFEASARALGGERLTFGDVSFGFRALPCLWLAAVLHLADDEFPAEASILFDGAASHYLPTEDLAVLGSFLSSRLIRGARASS